MQPYVALISDAVVGLHANQWTQFYENILSVLFNRWPAVLISVDFFACECKRKLQRRRHKVCFYIH